MNTLQLINEGAAKLRDNKISSKPSKYDIEELEGREFPFKD